MALARWRSLLPALWLGWMLAVAGLATPAPFAALERAEAGRVVALVLAGEAYSALALGVLIVLLERLAARRAAGRSAASQFSGNLVLALAAIFCTVFGYFALQPMMVAARAGQGALGFGTLHGASMAFFGLKIACVAALAWRSSRAAGAAVSPSPSS
jgi:hypothetical protein